jgi:transposase
MDQRAASHLRKLLMEGRFARLWMPTAEQRDGRQSLTHRHKLVESRSRVKERIAALDVEPGSTEEWSEAGQRALRELPLEGWARCRREDLLQLLA